jgi:Lipase maturation factor
LKRIFPRRWQTNLNIETHAVTVPEESSQNSEEDGVPIEVRRWPSIRAAILAVMLTWIFYATIVPLVQMFWREAPLPTRPVEALDPLRIANVYGLFAVMTPHRYEIEFQGSNDGEHWVAYPFRYKPQEVNNRPRIYAPYQPRFDWNLWFASLGPWRQNLMVPKTHFLILLHAWFVPCFGSTGSARWKRSAPKAYGGVASSWGCTLRHSFAFPMVTSRSWPSLLSGIGASIETLVCEAFLAGDSCRI